MPGKWSLDCEVKDLREAFREQGFGVPDCYAHGVSAALGGRYSAEQVFAEGDAEIESMNSAVGTSTRMIEAVRTRPIMAEFQKLGDATVDELTELVNKQKRHEASRIDLGPGTVFDKKELKAFCKATAKRLGYQRPLTSLGNSIVLQKRSLRNSGLSACMSLDAGGASTNYWETTAAGFLLIVNPDAWFSSDRVFLRLPGLVFYSSARPSNRELEYAQRHPPVDPATISSVSQLRAIYARHPRTPEEISDELKLCVVARFAFIDLLLEHLDFQA